jgi:hypothetical protein
MKALIAALALVTLIASPTFARPAARASPQAEFVFPTDQQLCRSGRTDFCHLSFPKTPSAGIRTTRQNRCIIRRDAFHPLSAWDVSR